MGSPVVWFEVAGRDPDGLARFYGEAFGWAVDANNPMRYGMVDTRAGEGAGIGGGIYQAGTPIDGGEYATFYVSVPDLGETIGAVERLGGKVIVPPTQLEGGPMVALVADPEGHVIGLVPPPPAA